jgi:hypothetical protein
MTGHKAFASVYMGADSIFRAGKATGKNAGRPVKIQ